MRLLREEEVRGYCQGRANGAVDTGLLEQAVQSGTWPALLVPVYELCRAVHFGSRAGLRLGHFRDCWHQLAQWHLGQCSDGYLLRLLELAGEEQGLLHEVWRHGRLEPAEFLEEQPLAQGPSRPDPRELRRDPPALRACFRKLGERWRKLLADVPEHTRRWELTWPDELPCKELFELPDGDLVLDTNFFVHMLDALPLDGDLSRSQPWQDSRVQQVLLGARAHFRRALVERGFANKLIIPASVLVEAYGVTHARRKHPHARDVLERMATQQDDWPLWNAFDFEPLSLGVFGAFLGLHELLVEQVEDRSQWPDFPDALVLAHALYNGCAVVSGEWVDKPHCWEAVRAHYPFLHPGAPGPR